MSFLGIGAANIGAAYGKVHITYESTGVAKAAKDVNNLQAALTNAGKLGVKAPIGGLGIASQIQREVANANKSLAGLSITSANSPLIGGARSTGAAIANAFIGSVGSVSVAGNLIAKDFGKKLEDEGKRQASSAGSKIGQTASAALGLGLKGGITAAAAVGAAAVAGVGYVLVKGFQRLENIDLAATKLKGLGRSAEEVKSIMNSALESVQGTAYSLDEAATAAGMAVAAGIKPGKDLTNYLKEIADNAAVAGIGMSDMAYYFNMAATSGRVTGDAMLGMLQRGIPVLSYLAKEYGVTEAKAKEMADNGQIDFAHFRNAMNANAGAALKMGNSISGSLDNLKTALARLGATILAPIFGTATGEASSFAKAIQATSNAVDGLGKWLGEHKEDMVNFWTAAGKAVLLFGHLVIDIIGWTLEGIGKLIEGIGHIPSSFAGIFDTFGAHGIAKNLRQASDNMTKWGNATFSAGQQVFHVNPIIDKLEENLDGWSKKAKESTNQTDGLADSAGQAAPKTTTLSTALEKLGLKTDKVTTQIQGSRTEYRKLMDELDKQHAPQDLIKTLEQLRSQWENGGRQIKSFADAIDSFGDSAESADSRAQKLIQSLQGLGLLPDDSAMIKYQQDLEEAIGWNSKLVDQLSLTGDALVLQGGQLDLNSKNGQTLSKTITQLVTDSTALVAAGKASPEEAYAYNTQAITALLARFGITDPAKVQEVLSKYFPQNIFQEALKHAGDPKSAIQDAFKDPIQAKLELDLLTQSKDIVNNIVGPDGKLHIPTVLDIPGAGQPGGPPGNPPGTNQTVPPGSPPPLPGQPPGTPNPLLPQTGPQQQGPTVPNLIPGAPGSPVPKMSVTGQTLMDQLVAQANSKFNARSPLDQLFSPGLGPDMTFGAQGATVKPSAQLMQNLVNLRYDQVQNALARNPDIAAPLQSLVEQGQQQGKNFAEMFAEGIDSGNDEVIRAIVKLATIAGDYLGHSPAKYGPLSGQGWVYYRGQDLTVSWSEGITSKINVATGASKAVAGASLTPFSQATVSPFNVRWERTIKDLQDFSDVGKQFLTLFTTLSDAMFNLGSVFNKLSGNRLFPKQYRQDPTRKPGGTGLPGFYPRGWNPAGASQAGTGTGQWSADWDAIAAAESGNNWGITYGQGPQVSGGLQIAKGTWEMYGGPQLTGKSEAYMATPDQQKQIAERILNGWNGIPGQGPKAWPNTFKGKQTGQFPGATAASVPGGFNVGSGTDIRPGAAGFPQWVYDLGAAFGLQASTYPGHQGGQGIDWWPAGAQDMSGKSYTPEQVARLQAFASFLANANNPNILQTIFANPITGFRTGVAGGRPVGPDLPGTTDTGYYMRGKNDWVDHYGHVHTSFAGGISASGLALTPQGGVDYRTTYQQPGSPGVPTGTPQNPVNVALPPADSANLSVLPQIPPALAGLSDPNIQRALSGGITNQQDAVTSLQSIDSQIQDLNNSGMAQTSQGKAQLDALNGLRTNIMDQFGLQEQPSALEQAQSIVSGITGLVGDAFGVIDESIKTVAATKDIADTFVRGVANTEDVYNLVDKFQQYLNLASKIASFTGDIMQAVGGMIQGAGAASAGGDMGGTMAAGMALSAAGSVSQAIGQVIQVINAGIDTAQMVYKISTKYLGRFLESWFGLPGANDIKYLLDTTTGQLKMYTSENPDMKTVFNTWGRQMEPARYSERASATNYFSIYQGPGQDPRDTMDDAMFSVRASGMGVFGYGG